MDNIESKSERKKHGYFIRFHGRVQCIDHEINSNETNEIVRKLNRYSHDIASEIASHISKHLPFETSIDGDINFTEGSIEWEGVLHVLTWTGSVGGTIGLIDYLRKAASFNINQTIKKHLPNYYQGSFIDTSVMIEDMESDITQDNVNKPKFKSDSVENSVSAINTKHSSNIVGRGIQLGKVMALLAAFLAGDAAITFNNFDDISENTETNISQRIELKELRGELTDLQRNIIWLQADNQTQDDSKFRPGICTCVKKSNSGRQKFINCPAKNFDCDKESREICEAKHPAYEC